jgi:hypothetical protein
VFSIAERLGVSTEAVEGHAWQWACMLRCAVPGIVKSFSAEKQTCTVQVAIQELILKPPPVTSQVPKPGMIQNIPVAESIAPLQDVPIIMMRVPGWSLTFPIVEGTECLLLFADMCIDGWWQNGGINPQYDRRRHDLSDAFALFGPWSQPNTLPGYSTDSVQLRSDDHTVVVDLRTTGVTITAPAVTINTTGATVVNSTGNVTIESAAVVHIKSNGGDTIIDLKDFLLHTHSGVQTGSGVSGPVV